MNNTFLSDLTSIRLILSSEKATLGVDFTITCVSNDRAIVFRRNVTNECTIAGGYSNGTCNLIGEYNHNYKYNCNNSTGEYMYNLTIPSSFNIDTLHGSRWSCSAPIEVVSSENIQLYVNVPIANVIITTVPTDNDPVEIISDNNQNFICKTNAGRPTSRIQWYISGRNITGSATHQTNVCKPGCNGKFISSSELTYSGIIADNGKIIYCTAVNIEGHIVRSENKSIVILYSPSVHLKPKYDPYIVYQGQHNIVLTCVIDDGNPADFVTYEWNSPIGTVNTHNLTILTVNNSHSGQYSCTATNNAGTSDKATKQIDVHYGPLISNISKHQDIIEGQNLIVFPIVDSNPVARLIWWTRQNGANFRYDGYVLRINTIQRTSSGNYACYVMNTLTPSGMNEINRTTRETFYVNVEFKPFLENTRPYSPSHVTAIENNIIHLTLTLTANPTPTIEWTFRAETDWDSCNFITIVSNTTTNRLFTSSSIFIDNVNSSNFGDYAFTARNTAGVFSRRFVVMKEAWLRQDMLSSTKENIGMFVAGVVTLVVGLLSLTISVIFVVRNSLKNKTLKSAKTDEYTGVQRSNPAFTDAYTTLHSDIEPRALQEQIINTYEECERTPEAHAYSSVDKMESEPNHPQHHDVNAYEECGKRIEAHAYDTLDK
ncbi:HMCN [Mytilus coruscus]|uniref:HMCN n=1 Tax=Mytilus coruscus TaxID=42192 RepID=A0A6J8ERQ3_MYTCO|nr:HMCN [Mytilus coruscus]